MISEETIKAARKYQEERFYSNPVSMIIDLVSAAEERADELHRRISDRLFRIESEVMMLREELGLPRHRP